MVKILEQQTRKESQLLGFHTEKFISISRIWKSLNTSLYAFNQWQSQVQSYWTMG